MTIGKSEDLSFLFCSMLFKGHHFPCIKNVVMTSWNKNYDSSFFFLLIKVQDPNVFRNTLQTIGYLIGYFKAQNFEFFSQSWKRYYTPTCTAFTKERIVFLLCTFLYKVNNMTGYFHLFDVFKLLILPSEKGLSDLNLAWSSVFLLFYLFSYQQRKTYVNLQLFYWILNHRYILIKDYVHITTSSQDTWPCRNIVSKVLATILSTVKNYFQKYCHFNGFELTVSDI